MVLSANMEMDGGVRWRKVTSVETSYSENFGNSLLFDVRSVVSPTTKRTPTYIFSIKLFMPNYVPVSPLPGATINNSFKLELELKLRFAWWESTDLVNEGSGYSGHVISYYSVKLGQRGALCFNYKVEISEGNTRLSHYNCIIRLPMPVPTSLLL
jgi:hypothetical protein